mgnify:CR=1 FL=1
MKVAVFSTKSYDKEHFNQANSQYGYELEFFDVRLEAKTARLAHHFPVVCLFVNDDADREVLTELAQYGTRVIALRCAGYNNVDLAAAKELGYHPNLLARSLHTKVTGQVAVLVDDFANPYKLATLEKLAAALQADRDAVAAKLAAIDADAVEAGINLWARD